jgi:hypothetical protein
MVKLQNGTRLTRLLHILPMMVVVMMVVVMSTMFFPSGI